MANSDDADPPVLDEERTKALLQALLYPLRDHLMATPHERAKVFEALNALAIGAAWVLAGIGRPDPVEAEKDMARVRRWFNQAIDENVDEIIERRVRRGNQAGH
jgi:hypothetical protein